MEMGLAVSGADPRSAPSSAFCVHRTGRRGRRPQALDSASWCMVVGSAKLTSDWYCPDTDQIVHNPVKRYLVRRCGEGHRVVRFQDPSLSSDMAFLWGTYLGMMITAALLYVSCFLV